jgi:hypothetical protein
MDPEASLKLLRKVIASIPPPIYIQEKNTLPIRLYTSFFIHPNIERRAEYEVCIRGNSFLEQHVFVDTPEAEMWIRTNVPSAVIHKIESFPTFKMLFAAGEKGYINIIANADILLTDTVFRLRQMDLENTALCIARWEEPKPSFIAPLLDVASQDVWVWRDVFKCPDAVDFRLGTPGCDNRIAGEMELAGYKVINNLYDIVTLHKHATNIRSYPPLAVPPPYLCIKPSHLIKLSPYPPTNKLPFRRQDTILHIGYPMSELQAEFKKNCDKYFFVHRDSKELSSRILDVLYRHRPTLTFCQIQAPGILPLETVKEIQRVSYSINWTGDARRPIPEWYKSYAPYFDVTLFSNETDVQEMRALGFRSEFLNIGFETAIYNPVFSRDLRKDIVFMGNNYPGVFPLSGLRTEMVKRLITEFGPSFGVWGEGWGDIGSTPTGPEEEACIYRGCKMAISLSHYDLERYFSDRMLRIMGCSALCLAKWYPGISKDFTDGANIVVWKDIPELIAKIRYYLNHPDEAFTIGRAASTLVHMHHTWATRLQELEYAMHTFPKPVIAPVRNRVPFSYIISR